MPTKRYVDTLVKAKGDGTFTAVIATRGSGPDHDGDGYALDLRIRNAGKTIPVSDWNHSSEILGGRAEVGYAHAPAAFTGNELRVSGQFDLKRPEGKSARDRLRKRFVDGMSQEWSFGYTAHDWRPPTAAERAEEYLRIFTELSITEVSPVHRGAGIGTGTRGVKCRDCVSDKPLCDSCVQSAARAEVARFKELMESEPLVTLRMMEGLRDPVEIDHRVRKAAEWGAEFALAVCAAKSGRPLSAARVETRWVKADVGPSNVGGFAFVGDASKVWIRETSSELKAAHFAAHETAHAAGEASEALAMRIGEWAELAWKLYAAREAKYRVGEGDYGLDPGDMVVRWIGDAPQAFLRLVTGERPGHTNSFGPQGLPDSRKHSHHQRERRAGHARPVGRAATRLPRKVRMMFKGKVDNKRGPTPPNKQVDAKTRDLAREIVTDRTLLTPDERQKIVAGADAIGDNPEDLTDLRVIEIARHFRLVVPERERPGTVFDEDYAAAQQQVEAAVVQRQNAEANFAEAVSEHRRLTGRRWYYDGLTHVEVPKPKDATLKKIVAAKDAVSEAREQLELAREAERRARRKVTRLGLLRSEAMRA